MTLVIYDNQGQIFSQITGSYLVPNGGVQYLEVEVPIGKFVESVDVTVTPHQAILVAVSPTEVDTLKQQLASTNADLQGLMDYLGEQGILI